MSFLNKLQMDLANTREPIESILLRGKILAHRLNSKELSEWVNSELDGYPGRKSIPNYRSLPAYSRGQIINAVRQANNIPIPITGLPNDTPDWIVEYLSSVPFCQGISEIEELLLNTKGELTSPWKPEILQFLAFDIFYDFQLMTAHFVIPRSHLRGIVSAVRNRFLNFSLALEKEFPEFDSLYPQKAAKLPDDVVKEIVNVHIYESNVAINSSTFQQNS